MDDNNCLKAEQEAETVINDKDDICSNEKNKYSCLEKKAETMTAETLKCFIEKLEKKFKEKNNPESVNTSDNDVDDKKYPNPVYFRGRRIRGGKSKKSKKMKKRKSDKSNKKKNTLRKV